MLFLWSKVRVFKLVTKVAAVHTTNNKQHDDEIYRFPPNTYTMRETTIVCTPTKRKKR